MTQIVYNPSDIDFAKPGKHHYQIAFQMDGNWGSSLIPITVVNGLNGPVEKNVVAFGGTHGNEYEGQVSVKRLCQDLDPAPSPCRFAQRRTRRPCLEERT